ncbi:DUF1801 domain-containing protein [Pseudonocardia abyssalis]|jgi:hypothetical protein|uniref:DUF1801 domain-containing protein n=1 Tax=Pseudonocardia abyssalis TaxID=2792008 RepID=A0ABS6UYU0_9PSEU|nr:DUF1801 domain-containing protein [Pseudonocardia abyssalis]MBW0117205.1 DUF1801 domain-containing protein [Pseudonocardia abyssalis]MBW0137394.1 DUF1801 domain-containing protein [Pseudonocardia abyssalis]
MEPANRNPEVDAFLDGLTHTRTEEVRQIRLAVLLGEPAITETVKWNAPNFRYADEDRVTFRLQPRDRVQLVLHRGARVRDDADLFRFDDPSGLLRWLSPDRGIVTLADDAETSARCDDVVDLVRRWIRA